MDRLKSGRKLMQLASIIISIFALVVSVTTAWLTLLRRGTIRMTQPTIIFFGWDGKLSDERKSQPKIFLRTLLYATSKRGLIIENMYVRLQRGESSQTFNIWVYGEDKLSRGSGLYVGEGGVAFNHHFLPPGDSTRFEFQAGEYTLDVYVSLVGNAQSLKLCTVRLSVSESVAERLREFQAGVYFDWGPDSKSYHSHVETRPTDPLPQFLLEAIHKATPAIGKQSSRRKKSAEDSGTKQSTNESEIGPTV
jgi:hypothetical protein